MIQKISHDGKILAIIIRANFEKKGLEFFTPPEFSQQLGYMFHPRGHVIKPHVHNEVPRNVELTQEVLVVKKGKVRVDLYDSQQTYLFSEIINTGDIILLANGGHGFEILEPAEMIEVKQGPYCGEADKVRFDPVSPESIRYEKNPGQ